MTSTKLISVKVPERLLRLLPAAGKGRSRFVIAALEEKISRRNLDTWKPKTKRGQRLAALLEKGKLERAPGLDDEDISRELMERRGRLH
jgi:hypothetical protein